MKFHAASSLIFYLSWTLVHSYNQRDWLYLLQNSTGSENGAVLVATWRDGDIPTGCEILTDKNIVDDVIRASDSSKIRNLSEDDMKILLDDCSQFGSSEEKMDSPVDSSTKMSIRDVIGNSYRELRRGKDEDNTQANQRQRQRQRYSNRRNNSRENDVETTTSLKGLKPSRRGNARTTAINRYSTGAPRRGGRINPVRADARRTTTGRNPTEPTRSATVRNSTRRTTTGRNSTESRRSATEGKLTRENARRTTNDRYPAESTTRINPAGRRRDSNVRTTTIRNNLETTTMTTSSSTVPGYNGISIIMPGTKWCGAGDIAQSQKDLGRSEETDKCCRDHDHCNDTLAPGETRGNLTNDSSFTLLNCRCDEEFYDCLDSSNSIISNTVGNLYFNILGRKCYKKDYPLVCKKYYTFFKITCREYESDTSQKRSYNWYPAKRYRKIFTK